MTDTRADGDAIKAGLELSLRAAIKARDTVAVSALRSVLAAIGNAEGVPQPTGPQPTGPTATTTGAGRPPATRGTSHPGRVRSSLTSREGCFGPR